MSGFEWQHIPDEVPDLAPGPALAAALSGLRPRHLSGTDLESLLVVQQKQINALHAAQMATMLELGLRDIGPEDPDTGPAVKTRPDEFSADAIRAALAWTRRAADIQFTLAWDLQTRIPAVYQAMCTGELDQRRAAIFSEWTLHLTDEQARVVCGHVLPDAPRLTTGELRERLKRECIAIDPDWAARRYAEAVKERRLVKSVNPDGSANLSDHNLPLDEAAEAKANVDRLVKKAKAAGDPRRRDLIAADIYLGLLSTYHGLTDPQIIKDLLTRATRETPTPAPTPAPTPGPGPGPAPVPGPTPDPGPSPGWHLREHLCPCPAASPRSGSPVPPRPGPAPFPRSGPFSNSCSGSSPHPAPERRPDCDPYPGPRPDLNMGWGLDAKARAGVEVRIELTTLLGWDDRPAHVPGWDHVHAPLARRMVRAQARGEWRYAITDANGRLDTEGITRTRPHGWRDNAPRCPGAVTELAIPRTLLEELATDPAQTGAWAAVITDIATQVAATNAATTTAAATATSTDAATTNADTADTTDATTTDDGATTTGVAAVDRVGAPNQGDDPSPDGEAQRDGRDRDVRRFPLIGLRRHTQIRDRRCCAPGCRAPARDCDADHVVRHSDGGSTSADNLQNLCRHDHALKDEGGWRAERLKDGTVRWQTRHGTVHEVKPPQIITDLPTPRPHRGPPTSPSP